MTILLITDPARGAVWQRIVSESGRGLQLRLWPDIGNAADIAYLVAWDIPDNVGELLPNLQVIFGTGAGVDHIDFAKIPPRVPVVRMVEPGIQAGMTEYVVMSVLAAHRNLIDYIGFQRDRAWRELSVLPASKRSVGVMGAGVLGRACLDALRSFGFQLRVWSRSRQQVAGVTGFAGAAELKAFLSECEILACLLPLTPATRGILNADVFSALPAGAIVINASRGGNLIEPDLLAALDRGHLGGAILDVFEQEPLPAEHPFWHHGKILLTPHIATRTQPETAAETVLANIERHRRGDGLINVVDPQRGY